MISVPDYNKILLFVKSADLKPLIILKHGFNHKCLLDNQKSLAHLVHVHEFCVGVFDDGSL